jgi:hypothetical protein
MSIIIASTIVYGLSAFAFGFGLRNLWEHFRSATSHNPSGRCVCGLPYDDCNHPITHGIRR